jgi:hypothetical protein
MRRSQITYVAQPDWHSIATGNVRVVPDPDHPEPPVPDQPVGADPAVTPPTVVPFPGTPEPTGGYRIFDSFDEPVGPVLPTRSEAVRHMGVVALQGASLPLTLRGPDGKPTNDRLP